MKLYRNIIQGSEQWEDIRRGIPTASDFSQIVTAKKGEYSASAKPYIAQLIAESFCPRMTEEEMRPPSYAEDRGIEMEPLARKAFTAHTGLPVEIVGFCQHDTLIAGCSPDGLIPSGTEFSAGLELKCPMPKAHVQYMIDDVLPDDYKQQVHSSMVITGIRQWHFFSFHPKFKPFHKVIAWDEYTDKVMECLKQFIIDYQAIREKVIPKLKKT